ncbi:hypothetical protein [Paracoccus sp. S1E-3]|uniref:hypothetical protein n=2 Tax=Paracoccus TaxID=265 RepID=UPI0015EE9659|nr:hypothetical protein [Paracoccus sp. S1E-3]MBA4492596.1 hypothetical protein [Paracoccus sp. S1E-3]
MLRAFLILLMLAMTPVHAASAAGMPMPPSDAATATVPAAVAMAPVAMADCCEDGSHRSPACQMQTDLRDPLWLAAPLCAARPLRTPPVASRLTGRVPGPALPPPRRI